MRVWTTAEVFVANRDNDFVPVFDGEALVGWADRAEEEGDAIDNDDFDGE